LQLIWPGTGWEDVWRTYPDSYVDKLANSETLTVGAILDQVSLFGARMDHFATGYSEALGLLKALRFTTEAGTLTPFPYDWRRDIRETAKLLHTRLLTIGAKSVAIVAHSMGGLIARYCLEVIGKPANVELMVLAAVPHHGAPVAFQNLLGMRAEMFLNKAQCRRISTNPRFPTAYQMLPDPRTSTFFSASAAGIAVADIYDAGVYGPLGLNGQSLDIARATWNELPPLALGAATPCQYFAIAGCQGRTVIANYLPQDDEGSVIEPTVAGDGIVPLWSAAPAALPCRFVPSDHPGVFEGSQMRSILHGLLTPTRPLHEVMSEHVASLQQFSPGPGSQPVLSDASQQLSVQVATRSVEMGTTFVASLVLLDQPRNALEGEITVGFLQGGGKERAPVTQPITYKGAPISKIDVQVAASVPGIMVIDFNGPGWPDDPRRKATVLVLPSSTPATRPAAKGG